MALEAKPAAYKHLTEAALEAYAFGRLRRAELESFEEHLLFCQHCQEKLNAEDDFVEAMAVLAAMESSPDTALSSAFSLAPLSLGFRCAFGAIRELLTVNPMGGKRRGAPMGAAMVVALLVAGLGIAVWLTPRSVQTAEVVELKTLRGGGDESVAEARPKRPLELSIDVGTLTNSVAEIGPYRVEVVDAAGNPVWTGTAISPVSSTLQASLQNGLSAGHYWTRLYAHSGKLLREFSLRVR